MATRPKNVDRRVQRTHQILQQAAIETMREKGFLAMTIQDITDRANVNRGTFYTHFPDKYAFLDELLHDQFQSRLKNCLPPEPRWSTQTLRLLTRAVLEHYQEKSRHCKRSAFVVDPLMDRATSTLLTNLLVRLLKQEESTGTRFPMPVEMIARIVSWTLLGIATHWYEEGRVFPLEQVADEALLMLMEGLKQLAPAPQEDPSACSLRE